MDDTIPPVELSHLNYGEEERNLEDTLNRNSSHYGRMADSAEGRETGQEQDTGREALVRMDEAAKGLLEATVGLEELGKKNKHMEGVVERLKEQVCRTEKEERLAASSAQEFAAQKVKTQEKLQTLRSSVCDKEGQVEQERSRLEAELVRWKKTLGLELITSRSGIVLTFTNLLRDEPDRAFRCELVLVEKKFKMERCNPEVKDLAVLVEQLNNTEPVDLSGFVVTLRQRFRDLAK